MREFLKFIWLCLKMSISHFRWTLDVCSAVLGIGIPFTVYLNRKGGGEPIDDIMNDLYWQIPIAFFATIGAFRVLLSPYWVYQEAVGKRDKQIQGLTKELQVVKKNSEFRIRITCGEDSEKSLVVVGNETWFRARLDLIGSDPVRDIDATVTDLFRDGKRVFLGENMILTMFPGMRSQEDLNRPTLSEGRPEFIDIIRVIGSEAIFPQKFYSRAINQQSLLSFAHTYEIQITICSSNHRTTICTVEFNWTGFSYTSKISLKSVKPPSE